MKNERILAHRMSKKLNIAELDEVSAAGTSRGTLQATYGRGGADVEADLEIDM
jgi:hypothetical protein